MLVTDAMANVGTTHSTFQLQGRTIRIVDGVYVDEDGTLAGSALDMASAVRNTVRLLGLPLPQAVALGSTNPSAFLGLGNSMGRIAPGYRADLVWTDDELNVLDTWIGGVPGSKP